MTAGMHVAAGTAIDRLMERASRALEATRYREAERLCARALEQAFARRDYEHMARIVLPLLEARRQICQLAADAGDPHVLARIPAGRKRVATGCYLLQPPLIAGDAGRFRERAGAAGAHVFVLVREPMTRERLWPLAAASAGVRSIPPATFRVKVRPPRGMRLSARSVTRDSLRHGSRVPLAWFEAGAEALGDAAIASLDPQDHPAWHVEDLMVAIDAHPHHEKLHQRLEEACRQAMVATRPTRRRPRRLVDDPFSF